MAPCRPRHKINIFLHRYDSGSVEGSVIKERVLVGGMAVNGVEMGLVRRQEQHIRGFKADGIVGLAFPSISTTRNTSPSQHSTFVQLLQEQFGVVGDLFSVYLTRECVMLAGCSFSPHVTQCHCFSQLLHRLNIYGLNLRIYIQRPKSTYHHDFRGVVCASLASATK